MFQVQRIIDEKNADKIYRVQGERLHFLTPLCEGLIRLDDGGFGILLLLLLQGRQEGKDAVEEPLAEGADELALFHVEVAEVVAVHPTSEKGKLYVTIKLVIGRAEHNFM